MADYYAPPPEIQEFEFYQNTQIEPFYAHNAKEYADYSFEIQRLKGYDRDSQATGVDLKLQPGDDLVLNGNGDLELETGGVLVQNALARRMATPPGGYHRYLYVGGQLHNLDEDYGNPLYYILSQPDLWEQTDVIQEMIGKAASKEVRVSNVTLERMKRQPKSNSFSIELHYRIKSNEQLYALELEINNKEN